MCWLSFDCQWIRAIVHVQDVVTFTIFDKLPDGGRRLLGQLRIAAAAVQSLQHIQGCFQVCNV